MDELKVIAILDRSAGNESVGEAWKETKQFPISSSIKDILLWAYARHNNTEEKYLDKARGYDVANFRGNLTITVSQ